jgi:hypothetical protein
MGLGQWPTHTRLSGNGSSCPLGPKYEIGRRIGRTDLDPTRDPACVELVYEWWGAPWSLELVPDAKH